MASHCGGASNLQQTQPLSRPLSGQGQRSARGRVAGASLAVARRRKERAYPELVLAHRWSDEAASFIRSLARAGHLKRQLGCAPVLSALLLPGGRPS